MTRWKKRAEQAEAELFRCQQRSRLERISATGPFSFSPDKWLWRVVDGSLRVERLTIEGGPKV